MVRAVSRESGHGGYLHHHIAACQDVCTLSTTPRSGLTPVGDALSPHIMSSASLHARRHYRIAELHGSELGGNDLRVFIESLGGRNALVLRWCLHQRSIQRDGLPTQLMLKLLGFRVIVQLQDLRGELKVSLRPNNGGFHLSESLSKGYDDLCNFDRTLFRVSRGLLCCHRPCCSSTGRVGRFSSSP